MEIFIYGNEQYLLASPSLTTEIERLQDELLVEKEQTLRAIADFRNYRRRVEHELNMLVEASKQENMNAVKNIINDMQDLSSKNNLSVIKLLYLY